MRLKYFLISVMVILFTGVLSAQQIKPVSSQSVSELVNKNSKIVLLDVRTPLEFQQGHLKGAVNIDARHPEVTKQLDQLDRNASYVVYCRTSNRSGVVGDYLVKKGFKDVSQMMDGYTGWLQNGLSVVK